MSCRGLLGDGHVGKDDPLARCSEECALGCGRTTTLRPFDTWINAQIVFWVTSMHRVFGFGGGTAAAAELPVHVVRYEELRHNTTAVLAQLLPFLGTYPTRRGVVVVTVDWGRCAPSLLRCVCAASPASGTGSSRNAVLVCAGATT